MDKSCSREDGCKNRYSQKCKKCTQHKQSHKEYKEFKPKKNNFVPDTHYTPRFNQPRY
jgi:hypothetical protein